VNKEERKRVIEKKKHLSLRWKRVTLPEHGVGELMEKRRIGPEIIQERVARKFGRKG